MKSWGLCIAVLDRGFIYAGDVSREEDGDYRIERARCLRYWRHDDGGLMGIARDGPTPECEFEAEGVVVVPAGELKHLLVCDASKW